MKKFFLSTLILFLSVPFICLSKESFKKIEIDGNCTGAYQVKIADINHDGKPDVAALGEGRDAGIFWYENPSWKKRPISNEATQRHIDMDFYDLDGDGKMELAVASSFNLGDSTSGGAIHWYKRRENLDSPWQAHFIHAEPTVHRLRWADVDGNGKKELIVLPILGVGAKGPAYDQAAVLVLCFSVPDNPQSPWVSHVIDRSLHLAHGLTIEKEKTDSILVASLEGITKFLYKNGEYCKKRLFSGNPHEQGRPGCSESAVGQWRDGKQFITAIEPWHGNQVVVYPHAESMQQKRTVIDTSFNNGHALARGDFDGDGDDEIIAGYRGKGYRIYMYDYSQETQKWKRQEIADDIAVQGVAVGDMNGNGKLDFVAAGGRTHNVAVFLNRLGE